jgi:hypothetical protein
VSNWQQQLDRVMDLIRDECGRSIDELGAGRVIEYIGKRRGDKTDPIRSPLAYFARTIRQHTFEFQQFVDEEGLAA